MKGSGTDVSTNILRTRFITTNVPRLVRMMVNVARISADDLIGGP